MNDFAARIRASLWWLVPLAVLAALIGWETRWGRAVRMVPPPEAPIAPRPVVTSLLPEYAIAGGTAARADTVQRTLFNPTRRPAATLAADQAKPKMQRGQFALTGTSVVDGKSTAFLRETAGGKSRRVQQGESVNGLVVAEVKTDRVKLAQGDESEELFLRVATNPRPTAQAAVAAPAPAPQAAGPAKGGPPVAAAAAPAAGSQDAAQSLADRRRAARAAQAAGQSQTPDGNPIPAGSVTGATPVAMPAPAAAVPAPPPGAAPDPRWQEVYRRYQQPR